MFIDGFNLTGKKTGQEPTKVTDAQLQLTVQPALEPILTIQTSQYTCSIVRRLPKR